jgi:hypothetical protein
MSEQTTDPGRESAWGDMMMPEEAARRQSDLDAQARTQVDPPARQRGDRATDRATPTGDPDPPAAPDPSPDPTLGAGAGAYAYGVAGWLPAAGLIYARPPLGPGNEAMEGGASPAPRGYTGGAMGKFVAGLSPSFAEAARGAPPPGGDQFYTASEAATTIRPGAGIAHPTAQPSPERTPTQRPNSLDVPTDSARG